MPAVSLSFPRGQMRIDDRRTRSGVDEQAAAGCAIGRTSRLRCFPFPVQSHGWDRSWVPGQAPSGLPPLRSYQVSNPQGMIINPTGLQFGLQFTAVRLRSAECAPPG